MENYKKLYKQMKRINILLVVLVALCLAMIVFLLIDPINSGNPAELPGDTLPKETDSETAPSVESEPTEVGETEAVTDPGQVHEDIPGMLSIETPYLYLRYPMEWKSYLQYTQTSTAGLHTVSFKCAVGGQTIPLFDVYLGHTDMGEQMGYLQDGDNVIPVCILFYEFVPDDTWRDEDTYILYAMQEAANDLISCLTAEENYLPQ